MARKPPSPTARNLIVDETLLLKGENYRVRIWCATDRSTICLVSQVPGGMPPDVQSSRIANLVLGGFLGFRLPPPSFYETSVVPARDGSTVTRVFRVKYEMVSHTLRPILVRPVYEPLSVAEFTQSMLSSTGCNDLF